MKNSNIALGLLLPFILIGITSCNTETIQQESKIISIEEPKDLIPEGIVIDPSSNKLYLSSVHKRKIIELDLATLVMKDLISSEEFGFELGVGMVIKDGKLFSLSGEKENGVFSSKLLVLNPKDGSLIHKYELKDTVDHFLNDLAISKDNKIYISNTKNHSVYSLDYPNGEIELFLKNESIKYPNGITISDDNKRLYVDSWFDGVRIVDLETTQIINKANKSTSEIGIDGMKYYKGNLYAIRNGGDENINHGLIKIKLSEDERDILGIEPLMMNDSLMNIPTTLDIVDGTIYVLANSQMANLDQETNEIIDPNILTSTYILKYKIPAK